MILPLTPRARAKVVKSQQSDSVLAAYATKPVEFAADILRVILTPDQELILDKLMDSPEVNVQSSHGQGKTLLAAIAVLHHVFCIKGLAVTTARLDGKLRNCFGAKLGGFMRRIKPS